MAGIQQWLASWALGDSHTAGLGVEWGLVTKLADGMYPLRIDFLGNYE